MKRYKKIGISLLIIIVALFIFTLWANNTIIKKSSAFITGNLQEVDSSKAGLLLGTSKYSRGGSENDFFFNRIEAAAELFKAGKIKCIIISGDNSREDYNEPQDMKDELIKRGIPQDKIYLDYAGFRTFDSVIRAKEIFGQTTFIVISQKFHNERAVYIARKNGIEAYGYNAKDVSASKGLKTKLREYFARDKVFLDMLFGVDPKFLGDKITIR
ncbi:MAG: ElyC/SanA/YdcF family protein [Bacteroidia bacterium]|jgi:SanA protein